MEARNDRRERALPFIALYCACIPRADLRDGILLTWAAPEEVLYLPANIQQDNDGKERPRYDSHITLDLSVVMPEQVSCIRETCCPQQGTRSRGQQEFPERHVAESCRNGDQSPNSGDEPADKDGHNTATLKPLLRPVQVLDIDTDPAPIALDKGAQPALPDSATYPVPTHGTEERTR